MLELARIDLLSGFCMSVSISIACIKKLFFFSKNKQENHTSDIMIHALRKVSI